MSKLVIFWLGAILGGIGMWAWDYLEIDELSERLRDQQQENSRLREVVADLDSRMRRSRS